jgi:hypothetical protein
MSEETREDGFELEGRFFRWHVTDTGKDLMLIDRFSGMPVQEFFETIEDSFDRGRAPILLALIATSIRNAFPDRSVERIVRQVMNLSISDVTFVEGDEEEAPAGSPPGEAGEQTQSSSGSTSDDSKGSSSQPETGPPETSYATPV